MTSCKWHNGTHRPSMGVLTEAPTKAATEENSSAEPVQDNLLATIVNSPDSLQEQILVRTAYTLSYNKDTRNPNWVAWCLTREHINGPYKREGLKFMEDLDVPAPRATNMDYTQSGYDRGHMCPSGDNRWSETAQRESFLYTNCCPQLHSLNAGDWNELENTCRQWAEKYSKVWIACGPIYLNKKHKRIGKNKVVVPEAFFKVVLANDNGCKAIGFIYRNEAGNRPKSSYVNTIDQVERITGYDFFSALPDDIEQQVESRATITDW